jgi:hypothetical protein
LKKKNRPAGMQLAPARKAPKHSWHCNETPKEHDGVPNNTKDDPRAVDWDQVNQGIGQRSRLHILTVFHGISPDGETFTGDRFMRSRPWKGHLPAHISAILGHWSN